MNTRPPSPNPCGLDAARAERSVELAWPGLVWSGLVCLSFAWSKRTQGHTGFYRFDASNTEPAHALMASFLGHSFFFFFLPPRSL